MITFIKLIRKSVKSKLFIIYVAVITLPIILFGGISYTMSTSSLERDYSNYQGRLNLQIVKTMEENIMNLTRQSMAVYSNLSDIIHVLASPGESMSTEYLSTYSRVSNYLNSLLQSNENLYAITLLSTDGSVLYYSSKQGNAINLYNVKDEPWFTETMSLKGMPLTMEPHRNKFIDAGSPNNKSVISISRSIINLQTSQPMGIIVFDQEISQFSNIVSTIEWENNQHFMVVGKSGAVIYSDAALSPAYYEKLIKHAQTNISGSFKPKIADHKWLVNFSGSEKYQWKVISAIPLSELKKKNLFLRNINLVLLIVLILFAFVLSLYFSYIVTIPLKKLLFSLRELSKGDFSTRVAVKGEDELSQIGVTFNAMVQNIENLIQQNYQIRLLKKQAELDALQSQINPHFLFNTLTSILSVIDKRDFAKSATMIKSLSAMFRYSLNKGKYIVSFSEELEHVKKYIYIQGCRFSDRYQVSYDIDDDVLSYGIVRLSLQPLIENAFIHGLDPKEGKGTLKITAKSSKDMFFIYIVDNGVGIERDKLLLINQSLEWNGDFTTNLYSEHMGIFNVNARIKLTYGAQYGLKLYMNNRSETVVKITLPAETLDKPNYALTTPEGERL
ncbi:cache domain-containing sensor histidine kinase [Paenibacillus nasutitermitis]|uniref:Histidine kinase n=1 Tax=Paenibacillus nasutitermitis TaxID=1652958 RepID=A0A917DQU2_9BACL|nr:sensor histidine kinase [Paenibacillus nasutitermitis]GGD62151.1 histidine kinase [Paenibacillus nasutitermitis]